MEAPRWVVGCVVGACVKVDFKLPLNMIMSWYFSVNVLEDEVVVCYYFRCYVVTFISIDHPKPLTSTLSRLTL